MKTVVGLYENITDAQEAINDLVRSGFDRADISLIASKRWADERQGMAVVDGEDDMIVNADQLGSDVAAGLATGGVVGGLGGVLMGLGALAIPGVGPIIAAGPLVAGLAGAGIGAAVGGLVGALVNWGVPPADAELYTESVRRGGILVGLKTDESQVERATGIMNRYGPINVERRSEYWRSTGWMGYDASSAEWSPQQMDADQLNYSEYLDYSTYTDGFREHYTTTYGRTGRDYLWYDPAYRYGYRLAQDQRYADFDTWDQVEAAASRGWTETEFAAERAWDDLKDAVRRGWEEVKDAMDFDFDSDYALFEPGFREHYQTQYGGRGHNYDYYAPDYRYGYDMGMDDRWDAFNSWEELESDARRGWEKVESNAGRAWDDFKDAVRRGWEDVRDALDMEADYSEHEPFFRAHYQERYHKGLHDYDWYEPAYRYGYISALDDRFDGYATWNDRLEADIRRQWEATEYAADSAWDEVKDAVRRGWDSVRDAFEMDEEKEYGAGTYTKR